MAGGRASKLKGDRAEREVVELYGGSRTFFQPEKDSQRGDVIGIPGIGRAEVKIRKDGFKQLYKWLDDNNALFVRADRKEWLVVMSAGELVGKLEDK